MADSCPPETYYQKNKEERKEYQKNYSSEHKEQYKEWILNNKEKSNERQRRWKRNHQEQVKEEDKKYRDYIRHTAMSIINKTNIDYIKCVNCNCNNIDLLEIHHKNSDGGKERKLLGSNIHFYKSILNGTRKTDDLEIRCSLCNKLHYIETKYNVKGFKVIWNN